MEYASWLAGEKWTDHPRCTHPLLAAVGRQVNDHISDSARSRLVPLIPSVVGLNGSDPRADLHIAVRCAAIALPVVAEHRQRALAVCLLTARSVLADLDSQPSSEQAALMDHARSALAAAPHAAQWAEDFTAGQKMTLKAFQRRSAPAAVRLAVVGIAEAAIAEPDSLLYDLFVTTIDDCVDVLGSESNAGAVTHIGADATV